MVPYLPKQIALRALVTYLIALAAVSLLFFSYVMSGWQIALGIIWVAAFFFLTNAITKTAPEKPESVFVRNLILIAFLLRIAWVLGSFFYYSDITGRPFSREAADELGYHEDAAWMAGVSWKLAFSYLQNFKSVSDWGFPLYLTLLYKVFGSGVLFPRVMNALFSTLSCVLAYRLSERTFGEETGMMTGTMMALMPNLVIYCGYHLKETLMIFLALAFLERLDYLIRNREYGFWDILFPTLLAGSLFLFRTILGAVALFSFASAILISSAPTLKKNGRRAAIIGWSVLCALVIGGGAIQSEMEGYWEQREANVLLKREQQTLRGSRWARYATGSVMAPMAFVLPFSTMIEVEGQQNQETKHSGNFIRNFMGFFAILAIYEAFRRKEWRNFTLIGSFVIAYLAIIAASGYSNSERFLLPALPGLIMMWAYGISTLREQTYKYLTPWCLIVIIMEVAWAFFKLGSRGVFL